MRRLLGLSVVLALNGCWIGANDCGFEPIGASIAAPVPGPPGNGVGTCGRWVKIGGAFWSLSEDTFDIALADLEPIGEATESSDLVPPLAGPTTYAIRGVDPTEAVAMESRGGGYLVFTRDSGALPIELCPMLTQASNPRAERCEDPPPDN